MDLLWQCTGLILVVAGLILPTFLWIYLAVPRRPLRYGCRVYHDIPFPYGNIDHVVVNSSGVYCVNTKTYEKIPENSGDANAIGDYTEGVMRFPDRRVTIPRDQLASESK